MDQAVFSETMQAWMLWMDKAVVPFPNGFSVYPLEKCQSTDWHVRRTLVKGKTYGYYIISALEDLFGNINEQMAE